MYGPMGYMALFALNIKCIQLYILLGWYTIFTLKTATSLLLTRFCRFHLTVVKNAVTETLFHHRNPLMQVITYNTDLVGMFDQQLHNYRLSRQHRLRHIVYTNRQSWCDMKNVRRQTYRDVCGIHLVVSSSFDDTPKKCEYVTKSWQVVFWQKVTK